MISETRESSAVRAGNHDLSAVIGGEVLLIDDETVVREIGSEMLQVMGLPCITAENGEEGIRLFKKSKDKIAVVILDVEMPGICGNQVYEILREMKPDVKILLISGYARSYLEAKYFKRKLEHFMPKPFQLEQLSKKLKSLVEV